MRMKNENEFKSKMSKESGSMEDEYLKFYLNNNKQRGMQHAHSLWFMGE